MSLRLPLYARFLVWLGLNLVLLAGVFLFLIRSELRLDAIMSGATGGRVQQVADLLFSELRVRPPGDWGATLGRFGSAYGVEFALLNERGERVAGPALEIPEDVRSRLRFARGGLRREPPGEGPGRTGRPGPSDVPSPGDAMGPRPERPPGGRRPDFGPPRVFLRTTTPTAYWVLVRGPLPGGETGRPSMGRLVIRSRTLSAGGLFFDFTPWWIGGGAVLVLSVLWWLPFVRSITGALGRMSAATERIANGEFNVALDERRRDELGRLGGAINRMSARLAALLQGQRRFLGDTAHELCAPIARMQVASGILEERVPEANRPHVQDIREELQEMSALVEDLLQFSRAGIQQPSSRTEVVELARVAAAVAGREAPGVPVEIGIPGDLRTVGDARLLARGIGNVVRNAVRHAGPGLTVRIRGGREGARVWLSVADSGPGVPESELPRLFEPFYRVDTSRSRDTGGVGLGLTIVKACVEAGGGRVTARNTHPGFEVRFDLPAAPVG